MKLSHQELDTLLEWIGSTREEEIDCDHCAALLAEFAEMVMTQGLVPERLEAVEQHLAVCAECREVFDGLRRALEASEDHAEPRSGPP